MQIKDSTLLDLYTDYLIVSQGYTTSTQMSGLLDNKISHDQITRFLASGVMNSRRLWLEVKPMCSEIATDDAVLILDDSIEAKPYTDLNELINWHYDHTEGRSVKGVNFITALYDSWQMSLPVNVSFVRKDIITEDKGKKKYKSSISKQQLYRFMVKDAASKLQFRYVLNDCWFASAENMEFIDDLDRYFIMAIKGNRKVALSWEEKQQGKYVSIKEAVPEGCVRSVWVEQLDFPILISRQVFKNGDGSTGTLYLASNDLSLTFEQVSTIYKRRWKVEVYHKSVKSNTAFSKSPTKTPATQQAHFIASILAFVKLERLKIRRHQNHFAMKTTLIKNATAAAWASYYKMSQPFAA